MIDNTGNIPYVNLKEQWKQEKEELQPIIERVLENGQYVGGEEVDSFEKNIAKYCNVKYAVATNSGTDALILALRAIGIKPGDHVITPPNSFVASTAAIVHLGATPIFVDVLEDQNINPELIEEQITKKTKAILPVHLTGRIAGMEAILSIAESHNIPVVEDAAQAIGSRYFGKTSGSIGRVGCFSTHPLKNLNACGDGGFITTNDESIYQETKILRNHGLVDRNTVTKFGTVSRMDVLQATILNYRLTRIDNIVEARRKNADFYMNHLNQSFVFFPQEKPHEYNTYHTFVIQVRKRDELRNFLFNSGIDTAIHYPIPIHLQQAAKRYGYKIGDFPTTESQASSILSLPIHSYLSEDDLAKVSGAINSYVENN